MGDDWRFVLASYNAGHAAAFIRGLNYDSEEARKYVERVAHVYQRNPWEMLMRLQERDTR